MRTFCFSALFFSALGCLKKNWQEKPKKEKKKISIPDGIGNKSQVSKG